MRTFNKLICWWKGHDYKASYALTLPTRTCANCGKEQVKLSLYGRGVKPTWHDMPRS